MNVLKAEMKKSGTEVSDALNNAISPKQAQKSIQELAHNLQQLTASAKAPAESFRITSEAISKGLSDIAQKAGLSEKEFAKLNEKMLQTQAQKNMQKAFDDIAKSAGLSSEEIKKLGSSLGYTSEQMKRVTGDIGQSTGVLDTVKKHWMALSAAAVGAFMMIGKAREYMKLGAMAQQAEEAFHTVATAAGENADHILREMKRASAGTVEESDIMQKALKGMALGLSGEQMINIMEAARISARLAGEDVLTAYENITDAIATNMPKALKRYGLITKEEMSLVNKAIAAGVEEVNLYQLAMANATVQAARMGDIQSNAAEQLQRTNAQHKELVETIGKVLIIAMQKLTGAFQMFAAGALGAAGAVSQLLAATVSLAAWTAEKLGFTEKATGMRAFAETTLQTAKDLGGAASELADKAAANMRGIGEASASASKIEIDAAKKTKEAWLANIKARMESVAAEKKAIQEKEAVEKAIIEVIRKANLEIEQIGKTESEKEILRINSEVKKWEEAGADKIKIQTAFVSAMRALNEKLFAKNIEDLFKSEEKAILDNYEDWKKAREAEAKIESDRLLLYESNAKALTESEEKEIIERYDSWLAGKKKEQEDAEKFASEIWKIERKLSQDMAKFAGNDTKARLDSLDEQLKAYQVYVEDKDRLDKWYNQQKTLILEDEAMKGDDFWAGLSAASAKHYREEDKAGKLASNIFNDYLSERNKGVSQFVDNFIAGQNAMVSVQKAAGDMMTNLAGDISKRMWAAMIDKVIGMIGAHIGGGAALVAWQGANKGGVVGALIEIGLYLGTAVAAMLAGRGMAQSFKAEGGWMSEHPTGGWIQQGSGVKDDVFLGTTPGVRHWGMGSEFIVNKVAAQKYGPFLEAINKGHAEGGPVGIQADWENAAEGLGLGTGFSFLHGFMHGGTFITGITEAIAFCATAIPSMFISKYAGNKFRSEGGWIDEGHGFGQGIGQIIRPFTKPLGGITDSFSDLFKRTLGNLPGIGQYIPNPFALGQILQDPEKAQGMILEAIREPFKQVAKDILTPNKYYSDPLKVAEENLKSLKELGNLYRNIPVRV